MGIRAFPRLRPNPENRYVCAVVFSIEAGGRRARKLQGTSVSDGDHYGLLALLSGQSVSDSLRCDPVVPTCLLSNCASFLMIWTSIIPRLRP